MQSTRKARATDAIQRQHYLIEIRACEPEKLEQIIDLALLQPVSVNLWYAYSALKKLMSEFVGWDAKNPTIKTSAHYDAMIEFILFLLPVQMEKGTDEPIGFPQEEEKRGFHEVDFTAYVQELKRNSGRSA